MSYSTGGRPARWLLQAFAIFHETWPNVIDRLLRWEVAFDLIRANPFRLYFTDFYGLTYVNYWGHIRHAAPHNIYIQAAASLTIFSPVLIIFLLYKFVRLGLKIAARVPAKFSGRVVLLTATVVGTMAVQMVSDTFLHYEYSAIVWLAICLVLAAAAFERPRAQRGTDERRR